MATVIRPEVDSKSALLDGAVRPWHVIFLSCIALAVSDVASLHLTKGEDAAFRPIARELMRYLISSAIIIAFVVVVPELRRPLPALFRRWPASGSVVDLCIALVLGLCWGYGIYRFVICLPLVVAYPQAFRILNFYESLDPFEARRLLFLVGYVVVAPVAEELVFRGYLMNLWIDRWGVWAALIASSLVFAAFHFERAVFAAPLGFIYALAYLKYDSLWPAILLHAGYNLLAFPWLLGQFFYVKQKATFAQIDSWSAEIILSLLFVPLVIAFWRRFAPRG
jgi:membrane protease YdiL (CAAX protease family)